LNTVREKAATASLGSPFQCLTMLKAKNFFPISNLNLSSLTPLPLLLSLQALVKGHCPTVLQAPLWVLEGCNKVSVEPSLLQAEQPQLSQPFLIGGVLQPSDHFCGLLLTRSNRSLPFCTEGSRDGHRTQVGSCQSRGAESSPLTFWQFNSIQEKNMLPFAVKKI